MLSYPPLLEYFSECYLTFFVEKILDTSKWLQVRWITSLCQCDSFSEVQSQLIKWPTTHFIVMPLMCGSWVQGLKKADNKSRVQNAVSVDTLQVHFFSLGKHLLAAGAAGTGGVVVLVSGLLRSQNQLVLWDNISYITGLAETELQESEAQVFLF